MMRFLTIFGFILLVSPALNASEFEIRNSRDCFSGVFSSYDSWVEQLFSKNTKVPRNKLKRVIEKKYPEANFTSYRDNLACSLFEYLVDDTWVWGYSIKSKSSLEGSLPVIIFNRGGNGGFGKVTFPLMLAKLFPLAQSGFAIVGSQYRGVENNDPMVKDEFGGADLADVLALIDNVASIVDGDPERIGIFGASRGGMQSFLSVKKRKNIKAIATIAATTDLLKELEFRPEMEAVYKKRIPNYVNNKETELSKRSVMHWADDLSSNVPVLLLHGEKDKRVSVNNSIQLAKKLENKSHPHKLVTYPNDDHILRKNYQLAQNEIIRWFKAYL